MSSRPTLTIAVGALAVLGFSACKTVYTDTFSYRKNSFKAPPEKVPVIKAPDMPLMPPDGVLPPPGGMPGAPAPEAGAIPGIPGAPAAPGAPAVPGAPPAVPGL